MLEQDRILVLGAGVGGLRVALGLDRLLVGHRERQVLLVDQHDYHVVGPRLPGVAADFLPPQNAALSIRRLLGARRVDLLEATVEGLDLGRRVVRTSAGLLPYRWLVVALGVEVATRSAPGVADHALRLSSIAGALRVREAVGEAIRQAAWKLEPAERETLGTIVVVGAGYTGVELAAALANRVAALAAHYRLPAGVGRVVLVEQADRVLPGCDRPLSEAVLAGLGRVGVEIRLGIAAVGASAGEVKLATGDAIRCGALVWAGGIEAPAVVRSSGLPLTVSGKIVVDRQLRLPEHPGAFALGDACAVLGEGINALPPSAQLAAEQGDVVARNLAAEVAGSPLPQPAEYHSGPRDVVVPLGRSDAVAQARGVVLTDWRAAALRRLADVRYLEVVGGPSGLLAGLLGGGASPGGGLW